MSTAALGLWGSTQSHQAASTAGHRVPLPAAQHGLAAQLAQTSTVPPWGDGNCCQFQPNRGRLGRRQPSGWGWGVWKRLGLAGCASTEEPLQFLLHLTFSCSFRECIIKVINVDPIPAIKMMQRRISTRRDTRKKWKMFQQCCGLRRGLSATPCEGHQRTTEYPEWDPQGSLSAAPGSTRSTIRNLNRV